MKCIFPSPDPIEVLESQNPSIDLFELHKFRRFPDSEALNLWKIGRVFLLIPYSLSFSRSKSRLCSELASEWIGDVSNHVREQTLRYHDPEPLPPMDIRSEENRRIYKDGRKPCFIGRVYSITYVDKGADFFDFFLLRSYNAAIQFMMDIHINYNQEPQGADDDARQKVRLI